MEPTISNVLNNYSMLTYYDETRDENGCLLFCNGHSFDKINFDKIMNLIVLTNSDDPSSILMFNSFINYEIIPLKYAMDKLVLQSGKNTITLFCKKK